jgi:pyruvate dehydrogenase E1 component alpha subunit
MLKARLLEQRFRRAAHTGEAILAGTLQNAEACDVIVSATPHPILEVLRGGNPAVPIDSNGDRSSAGTKLVAAEPQIFAGLAAGLASASRVASSACVVIGFALGKATQGPGFEEAAKFAGKNRLPLVIVADWSDSRRSSRSHEGRDLSRWPFPTIAVDGRDAIAVYRVTKEAISAARRGHGPTLVDCVNFPAPGARGRDQRDPLLSFRAYLQRHGAWSEAWYNDSLLQFKNEVAAIGKSRVNPPR